MIATAVALGTECLRPGGRLARVSPANGTERNIQALRTYARLAVVSILAIAAVYFAQVQYIGQGDFTPGLMIVLVVAG
jgi:hypothetical protein